MATKREGLPLARADVAGIQRLHSCGLLRGSLRPAEEIYMPRALVRDKGTHRMRSLVPVTASRFPKHSTSNLARHPQPQPAP